jgi:enoyl-CoA hydratase/carnithine racemase
MAPREAALVAREVGPGIVRQMLLEATIFPASDMLDAGFLSRVLSLDQLAVEAQATGLRIDTLAPQATRLNKQTLRALVDSSCPKTGGSYHYADSAEHREGIVAFLEKRAPEF